MQLIPWLALVLALSIAGPASAQTTTGSAANLPSPGQPIALNETQKAEIAQAIRRQKKSVSPANFRARIGEDVPPSLELYMLPDEAAAGAPHIKLYKYTVAENKIVLVDPTAMRVVAVLDH